MDGCPPCPEWAAPGSWVIALAQRRRGANVDTAVTVSSSFKGSHSTRSRTARRATADAAQLCTRTIAITGSPTLPNCRRSTRRFPRSSTSPQPAEGHKGGAVVSWWAVRDCVTDGVWTEPGDRCPQGCCLPPGCQVVDRRAAAKRSSTPSGVYRGAAFEDTRDVHAVQDGDVVRPRPYGHVGDERSCQEHKSRPNLDIEPDRCAHQPGSAGGFVAGVTQVRHPTAVHHDCGLGDPDRPPAWFLVLIVHTPFRVNVGEPGPGRR